MYPGTTQATNLLIHNYSPSLIPHILAIWSKRYNHIFVCGVNAPHTSDGRSAMFMIVSLAPQILQLHVFKLNYISFFLLFFISKAFFVGLSLTSTELKCNQMPINRAKWLFLPTKSLKIRKIQERMNVTIYYYIMWTTLIKWLAHSPSNSLNHCIAHSHYIQIQIYKMHISHTHTHVCV